MQARANTEKKFLYKYLLIGIGTLLYSLYCFYDAAINYPALRPISAAYDEVKADIEDQKADATDSEIDWAARRQTAWEEVATTNGWDLKPPKNSAEKVTHNIQYSYGLGAVCAAIGLPCLLWFFKNKGTWLGIDGTTISSSDGKSFDFSQVVRLDKKKWEKKGLADVHYKDADGNEATLVLDDLKYERPVVDQMIAELESSLSPEQIVNGPTEVELAAQRTAAQEARQQRLAEVRAAQGADEPDE